MNRTWDVTSSVIASTLVGWRGSMSSRKVQQPEKLPELYDSEGCPKCRMVRAACTELNLDIRIIPVPKGGSRFLSQLKEVSGSDEVPYLVDPNTNTRLGDAASIVEYLFRQYAGKRVPIPLRVNALTLLSSKLATSIRQNQGVRATDSLVASQDLTLYSFESSPYSRIVREKLSEMELPYILINIGKQQVADIGPATQRLHLGAYKPLPNTKRSVFFAKHGTVQVPYLIDPNTGVDMFESADISVYLDKTYKR